MAAAATRGLELVALPGMPLVQPGDDLTGLILDAVATAGRTLEKGDILVLAQKIVSKAEGRTADLNQVTPSSHARRLATLCHKDERLVELILGESTEVLGHRPGVLVVVHRSGIVLANAGIDASNVGGDAGTEQVLLLPKDADASCRRLRQTLRARAGIDVAVIVNDSLGRAWRIGTVGIALGASGLSPLVELHGRSDLFGRPLSVAEAVADELAAAATLVQGQADEGTPVVLVRGVAFAAGDAGADALIRAPDDDLFR